MKHRLSAGKAGERPAMKREEQGPLDGILWPERLWLGAGDAEVTKPPNQGVRKHKKVELKSNYPNLTGI